MIDINKSIEEFKKYSNRYDMNNKEIERKYKHSFRVMEESKYIAKSLNLSQEQIDLATLIGLIHDIARYEQMKRYRTFKDALSIDHGFLGVEILEENNFIRKFVENDKYDNIIKKAIRNHNKYEIEKDLNEEELLQTKIIRDADKLDIFYEGAEIFWDTQEERDAVLNLKINNKYFEKFMKKETLRREKEQNELENLIVFIAFIYDMNFEISLEKVDKENYINKILDKFNCEDKDTIEKMKKIRKIANEYVQRKG